MSIKFFNETSIESIDNIIQKEENEVYPTIDMNGKIQVLVIIHKQSPINYDIIEEKLQHEYIQYIKYIWDDNIHELNSKKVRELLSYCQPVGMITIGENNSSWLLKEMSVEFEWRKRWLHYNSINDFQSYHIENCIFYCLVPSLAPKGDPLITVFTPTYESKHRIYRAWNTLLNQTFKNWEWVIIDDSKTEDTWLKLCSFKSQDPRVKIYKRDKNCGNIGMNKRATCGLGIGEFFFELDHDDELDPKTFEYLLTAAKLYPDCGFFSSDWIELHEDNYYPFTYGENWAYGYGSSYRTYRKGWWQYVHRTSRINPMTIRHIVSSPNHLRCWRRNVYEKVGGHSTFMKVVDDYELMVKTFLETKFCNIAYPCYFQYRNSGGDNFTFHRNKLIQWLTSKVSNVYNNEITKRFQQLNINDSKRINQLAWTIDPDNHYPKIDYTYDPRNIDHTIIINANSFTDQTKLKEHIEFHQQLCPTYQQIIVGEKIDWKQMIDHPNIIWSEVSIMPVEYAQYMLCTTDSFEVIE